MGVSELWVWRLFRSAESSAVEVGGNFGFFNVWQGGVAMSNEFRGTGNLGDNPALKYVLVKGEERAVMEMRIFFDEYKPDGDGGFEQVGGFWLNASVWGQRAESASKLLRKGARVRVEGRLKEQEWKDKETGEVKKGMQLDADEVFVSLSRIESISFKAKSEKQEHAA